MEPENVAVPEMNKERIVKEDGRYLIYFTFEQPRPDDNVPPERDSAANPATPATPTGEQADV